MATKRGANIRHIQVESVEALEGLQQDLWSLAQRTFQGYLVASCAEGNPSDSDMVFQVGSCSFWCHWVSKAGTIPSGFAFI